MKLEILHFSYSGIHVAILENPFSWKSIDKNLYMFFAIWHPLSSFRLQCINKNNLTISFQL